MFKSEMDGMYRREQFMDYARDLAQFRHGDAARREVRTGSRARVITLSTLLLTALAALFALANTAQAVALLQMIK